MIENLQTLFPEYDFKQNGSFLLIFNKGEEFNFTSVDLRGNRTIEEIVEIIQGFNSGNKDDLL